MKISVRIVLLLAMVPAGSIPANAADFVPVVQRVEDLAKAEIERGILTGVSVALVDDQSVILTCG